MATINILSIGVAKQTPDQMVITININNLYNTYQGALSASELAYSSFIKAFEKEDFDTSGLQLEAYSIDEDYEYINNQRQLRGYKYNYRISYPMDLDFKRYQDLLKLVSYLDSKPILDLAYGIKDKQALRLLAIKDAIEKGQLQAEYIAKTLSGNLGKLTKIDLRNEPTVVYHSRAMMSESMDLAQMAVVPMEEEVTLSMDFQLEV